ncbi:hypothetical protein O1R50_24960 [Glycomyces luteolus]|uniref:Uncharacterized protein n=1 Tax=Glycomyces luteolus TaxID=2670330 RepID=A0A9X3SSS8_9ACTN|nr:hypothetical protein [Glycomyces luteolus]MDA1362891.1 hypothetical protein [Glycomyces luteolus]
MSSDTSAPSSNAPSSKAAPRGERAAEPTSVGAAAPPPETPGQRLQAAAMPGRHEPPRDKANRLWTWILTAAVAAFCAALVLGAMRLYTGVDDVTDTPVHTVDAFLEALLDHRDAEAAAAWLCADKADRDLGEAVAALSDTEDGTGEFAWDEVTETGRSVGAATVAAEIRIGEGGAFSDPATWVFSLVAEEGDPQWLICGISAA